MGNTTSSSCPSVPFQGTHVNTNPISPFDIHNHVDFDKYISKADCATLVKKQKSKTSAVPAPALVPRMQEMISKKKTSSDVDSRKLQEIISKCKSKIAKLSEHNNELKKSVDASAAKNLSGSNPMFESDSRKLQAVISKCKSKIAKLSEHTNELEKSAAVAEKSSSDENLRKLHETISKCKLKIAKLAERNHELEKISLTDIEHHPQWKSRISDMERKHTDELERARSQVELSWKHKMYTDIQMHPQYAALMKEHQLDIERERERRTCPDVLQNPEYHKLMSKYIACKDKDKDKSHSSCRTR